MLLKRCVFAVLTAFFVATFSHAQLRFELVPSSVIEQRLQSYKGSDEQRESTLKTMFQSAGCIGVNLSEQTVKGLKQPNLICSLKGTSDSLIVVGAHFDHVDAGDGVVDNWSGASLLPSLYEAIKIQPLRHTFLFIGFAGEEKDLGGSHFYVESLSKDYLKKIDASIIMDTMGLGPTEVWASRSNPDLVGYLNGTAKSLNLPLTGVNVDRFGMSDEEYFLEKKVPTITIHTLTNATIPILHSSRDRYSAIHFGDYYDSYKLLAAYLLVLDGALGSPENQPNTH